MGFRTGFAIIVVYLLQFIECQDDNEYRFVTFPFRDLGIQGKHRTWDLRQAQTIQTEVAQATAYLISKRLESQWTTAIIGPQTLDVWIHSFHEHSTLLYRSQCSYYNTNPPITGWCSSLLNSRSTSTPGLGDTETTAHTYFTSRGGYETFSYIPWAGSTVYEVHNATLAVFNGVATTSTITADDRLSMISEFSAGFTTPTGSQVPPTQPATGTQPTAPAETTGAAVGFSVDSQLAIDAGVAAAIVLAL